MLRARLPVVVVVAVALALVASASAETTRSLARSVAKPAGTQGVSAQLALQRALAVFAPARVEARYRGAVADVDPRDATLILRDLVAAKPRLSRADRQLANALLARPTDGGVEGPAGWNATARASKRRVCKPNFCIHWVTKTNERPSLADNNPNNNRPDYVDKTIVNMNTVWSSEIGTHGYAKPLADGASGGHHGGNPNTKIDIFISNIGNAGLYGYCTTDDPRVNKNNHRQNSAYCVIDNNFSPAEFTSGATRNAANKVTLAHEFFHAVQFRYDTFDNRAMMEGTATWMEDQVFTDVNDNIQYLDPNSPLGSNPFQPLDAFFSSGQFSGWQYGTWIFYRFLSENAQPGPNDDVPIVVRQIWNQAVGKTRNGFGAISPALVNRGTTVLDQMRIFGEWNSTPRAAGHYREGAGQSYPTPVPVTATPRQPNSVTDVGFEMQRRSNDYLVLEPASNVGAGATLDFSNVSVPTANGDIQAIVFHVGGTVDAPVDMANGGSVPFDFAGIDRVQFVFTNASGSKFLDPNGFDFTATVSP
jgi:hypothetical protein